MSGTQTWDPSRYSKNARFVSDLASPVVELLDPKPGERILDLGCGDGVLTQKFSLMGCDVIGIDSSPAQIEAVRRMGLQAYVMDAEALSYDQEFDAVFSNAVLHWIKRPDQMIAGVWRALRPGGRFVAEMGGQGNVAKIVKAIHTALSRRGIKADDLNPWYFPMAAEYQRHLEKGGFEVIYIALISRPTPLPGDITGWLETFAESFTSVLPAPERLKFTMEVQGMLYPELHEKDGKWIADYIRLRFAAKKKAESPESGTNKRLE